MYVEEITTKRKGKIYTTALVRESFRKGSKVNHRTITNITKLPKDCIEFIKKYLKGTSNSLDISKIQILNSKEYGASAALLTFARFLKLDQLIHAVDTQWRENILAVIVGRLIYPDMTIFAINKNNETMLWKLCGHDSKRIYTKENLHKDITKLLNRKKDIQNELADIHLQKKNTLLCFMIPSSITEEYTDSELSTQILDYKQEFVMTGIITNFEGCPIAIDVFSNEIMLNPASINSKVRSITHIINRGPLALVFDKIKQLDDFSIKAKEEGFFIITRLMDFQVYERIQKKSIPKETFSFEKHQEIIDPTDPSVRYIVYFNLEQKMEDRRIRNEAIKKCKELLKEFKETQKSDSIKNYHTYLNEIWSKFKTKHLFKMNKYNDEFVLDNENIEKEELLDGFSIITTNISNDHLSVEQVISGYKQLKQKKQIFTNIKTTPWKLTAKNRWKNNADSQVFLNMLSYYIRWNVYSKLHSSLKDDLEFTTKFTNFDDIINKLKEIRLQTIKIEHLITKNVMNSLDNDHKKIITQLGVQLIQDGF